MKSFGIKRDEKDPRWEKFIEWGNKQNGHSLWNGKSDSYYGINKVDDWDCVDTRSYFDRILTLDEWEAEFMQPKLAGREYDAELVVQLRKFLWVDNEIAIDMNIFVKFINQRYAKPNRISEIKAEMEKLSIELKELEG